MRSFHTQMAFAIFVNPASARDSLTPNNGIAARVNSAVRRGISRACDLHWLLSSTFVPPNDEL
jgi:hypothetical protein